jgi:hypothetical protein
LEAILHDIGKELANLLDGEQSAILIHREVLLPEIHHILSILIPRWIQPFDVGAKANLVVEVHGQVSPEAGERGRVGARVEKMANGRDAGAAVGEVRALQSMQD